MTRMTPWEITPELTEERLSAIAGIMKQVRDDTVELHQPEDGDGPWSLGCRVYERTINILEGQAESIPWLSCQRDNLFFLLSIEGVPIRFYRGEVDRPTKRTLKKSYYELNQEQLHFGFPDEDYRWRICIETDTDGSTLQIHVAQFNEAGECLHPWEILTRDAVTPFSLSGNSLPLATHIPPPYVEDKEAAQLGEAVNE